MVSLAVQSGDSLAAGRPELSLPLACEPQVTCFIQSYMDVDPTAVARDFSCGSATYDTHNGVDFRLLSAAAAKPGVSVLAAADGVVKGMRDGMTDAFLKEIGADAVKGRECGNGMVIDHGDGWETQYCHLKKGSVAVKSGQSVKRGERLGDVGFSGSADFAHVHLSVRHNGKPVDPFFPGADAGACDRQAKGPGLWRENVAAAFPYRNGELIAAGFAGAPVAHAALELDHLAVAPLEPSAAALVVYVRFLNLLKDDRIRIVIVGPNGSIFDQPSEPLATNKATYTQIGGRKRQSAVWPSGKYEGRIELLRGGAVVQSKTIAHVMP